MIRLIREFLRDRSGNFAGILGVTMPMLVLSAGMSVDIYNQQRVENELQAAVDASVLAGAAIAYEGATSVQIEERVKAFFLPACPLKACETATLNVTFLADRLKVTAAGTAKTHFMSIGGKKELAANATAEVTLKSVPVHYEVHMVLDNSGSMNIVDGVDNIRSFRDKFKPWNSICAFACHTRGNNNEATYQGKTGADLARENGIPLREDRVKTEMIDQAKRLLQGAYASRVKVGVYDFDWWVNQRQAPTHNFGQVQKAINDVNNTSGGTQYVYFANELARLVGASGTGIDQKSPKKAIVMITDGVQQNMYTGKIELISQSACNKYKEQGRELFILNMVYPDPLEIGNQWYGQRDLIIPLRPKLEPALQQCASPGRYYRAEYGTTIDAALQSITDAIMRDARQMYLAM
ncbi:MAG: hypothetical protein HC779_05190 [Phyllobacteriaceae bacterium]|nr:hypothetical protein [Phyllobacteriaceae bacterium]